MKKIMVLTVLTFCIAFAGCSKDGEIDAFITEFEGITQEMAKKIESGDVAGAKKAFDAKKDSLKTSWDGIKGARGFQVTEESRKKLMDSVTKNMGALSSAVVKGSMNGGNPQEMKSLMEDYKNVFQL